MRGVTRWLKDALLIPQRAINDLQGKSQIAVVGTDGKVDLRLVEVGPTYASMQVITEGLKTGENVVVEGMQKLREGMTVKTTPWKAPEGFEAHPELPAPVEPKDTDFQRLPPTAEVDGGATPATPASTPEASPSPEPAASPASAPAAS